MWFREVYPSGILKTQMIAMNGEGPAEYAVFKTEVFIDSERGPLMVASAHKKETRGGFDDFIEKAETGSIGRALALAGFGTQFCLDELDEKMRLADSPVEVINGKNESPSITPVQTSVLTNVTQNGTGGRASFRKAKVATGMNVTEQNSGDDI